jgi:DNA-directed RNA polymerase subunit RPC12/RpoP
MWRCTNCKTEIEDKYAHCWSCGAKRVVTANSENYHAATTTAPQRQVGSVPHFGSFEQMVPEPRTHSAFWRRGPFTRIFAFLIAAIFIGVLKFFESPFFAKYGTYLILSVGGLALILILWSSFRRDKSDSVGIKLH